MNIIRKMYLCILFVAGTLVSLYLLIKILYLKFVCSKKVEATITDMELVEYGRNKSYIPTLNYTYNGTTYNTKPIEGFVYGPNVLSERLGTKIKINIDAKDPSHLYNNLGLITFFYFIFLILNITLLIVLFVYN